MTSRRQYSNITQSFLHILTLNRTILQNSGASGLLKGLALTMALETSSKSVCSDNTDLFTGLQCVERVWLAYPGLTSRKARRLSQPGEPACGAKTQQNINKTNKKHTKQHQNQPKNPPSSAKVSFLSWETVTCHSAYKSTYFLAA